MNLESISIPDGVESVGDHAFYYCTNLSKVTIHNGETDMVGNAFDYCSSLVNVELGNGATHIGDRFFDAFKGAADLTIAIPHGVVDIGTDAFDDFQNLSGLVVSDNNPHFSSEDGVLFDKNKTVLIKYPEGKSGAAYTVPLGVGKIEDEGFANCVHLESVSIPASVTDIGEGVFGNSRSLSSIEVSGGNPSFSSEDGVLFNRDGSTIIRYPEGKGGNYSIPGSVTQITERCFYNCAALKSVYISDDIELAGVETFRGCTDLTSVSLGKKVREIGLRAFTGCVKLTGLTICGGDIGVHSDAFGSCLDLVKISIRDDIETIGSLNDFWNILVRAGVDIEVLNISYCDPDGIFFDVAAIEVPEDNRDYSSEGGVLFNKEKSVLIRYPIKKGGEYRIPGGVASIGGSAFSGSVGLTRVVIGDGITEIDNGSFADCPQLRDMTIGNSVTRIGEGAFYGCVRLQWITTPESVTVIESEAFIRCGILWTVTVMGLTPPTLRDTWGATDNFFTVYRGNSLRVPAGCVEAYKSSAWGECFSDIVEQS